MPDNNNIDAIALFNTLLGLVNMDKNTMSQIHSQEIEDKIDLILTKLEAIERRIES